LFVSLEESAVVSGSLYVEGQLDIQGKVNGTVHANEFLTRTKASSYLNYMLNGEINSVDYPEYVLLPYWSTESKCKNVAKWLN